MSFLNKQNIVGGSSSRPTTIISRHINNFKSSSNAQLLLLITLLGFALRIYQLGSESLWLDEATTFSLSSGTFGQIFQATSGDVHPPLYYYLVHFFLLAGDSEFMVRLPSMLLGVLSIPLIYLVTTRLFSQKEGLISSFLLSISLMHIFYSQEARMYSMLAFLTLASLYFFYYAIETNKKEAWILFVLFTIMNIYTHYFGFFIFPIEILYYFLINVRISKSLRKIKIKNISHFKMFILSVVTIIILIIPRIQVFIEQAASRVGGEVTWGIGQSNFLPILLARFSTFSSSQSFVYLALFTIGIFASIAYNRKQALLIGLWFILPIIVSYYLAAVMPFQPRYLIFLLPAFLILVSRGITALGSILFSKNTHTAKYSVGTKRNLLLVILSTVGYINSYYSTPNKNDWRAVSSYLGEISNPGDVIVPLPGYMAGPLQHYYDNSSDNTYVEGVGYSSDELDAVLLKTSPNKVIFVLTGDINAANPEGTVVNWLQENTNMVNVITGVYILMPKN
jgi:4-amino-4-deoxy-L-arabinose transferase-like glycosyltransferase